MNNPLVIYHRSCSDGLAAAWAAFQLFGMEGEYLSAQYRDPLPSNIDGRDVYVLDFSFSRDQTFELAKRASKLVLLDHHITAFKLLEGIESESNVTAVFDTTRSGAKIAWDYFFPNKPTPLMIEVVQDRDLWKFAMECTKPLTAWLQTRPMTVQSFEEAVDINKIHPDPIAMGVGNAIIAYQEGQIRSLLKGVRMEPILVPTETGENVIKDMPVFNCAAGGLISDACSTYLADHPGIVLCYFDTDKQRVFSLRSSEGVDCSPIAVLHGGGGHARACGFSVPLGDWPDGTQE